MLTNHERSSGRIEIKIYLIIKMSSSDVSSTKTPPPRRNSKNVMKNEMKTPPPRRNSKNVMKNVIRKALMNNKESNVREYAEVRERILSKLKASMLGLKLDLNGINKKNRNAIRTYNSRKIASTFSPIKLNKNNRLEQIISEKQDLEKRLRIHQLIIKTFNSQLNTPNKISLRRLKELNKYTNMDNFIRDFKKEYKKYSPNNYTILNNGNNK